VIAQWGPFQLGWHGIFTALAVMVALWLAGRLAIQRGIPSEVVYGIASIAGGLIGARLFHVADHLSYYLVNPLLIPAIWEGGIAVYGAFIWRCSSAAFSLSSTLQSFCISFNT